MDRVDEVLNKVLQSIETGQFVDLETHGIEFKPVPPTHGEWKEFYKSVNSFLNTRGGVVILGIKEEKSGKQRQFKVSGWQTQAEPKVRDCQFVFTDLDEHKIELPSRFKWEIRDVREHRVCLVFVDELSADEKYVLYEGVAYRRVLTADETISDSEITEQRDFQLDAQRAYELQPEVYRV